jgi:hypothetical protein
MTKRTLLGGKKMAVSVLFDVVKLEIICGDDYEAQVLFEDLIDRLKDGQDIQLSVKSLGESK